MSDDLEVAMQILNTRREEALRIEARFGYGFAAIGFATIVALTSVPKDQFDPDLSASVECAAWTIVSGTGYGQMRSMMRRLHIIRERALSDIQQLCIATPGICSLFFGCATVWHLLRHYGFSRGTLTGMMLVAVIPPLAIMISRAEHT